MERLWPVSQADCFNLAAGYGEDAEGKKYVPPGRPGNGSGCTDAGGHQPAEAVGRLMAGLGDM